VKIARVDKDQTAAFLHIELQHLGAEQAAEGERFGASWPSVMMSTWWNLVPGFDLDVDQFAFGLGGRPPDSGCLHQHTPCGP